MAKAERDGIYTLPGENGRVKRFVARKGDVLPEGAAMVDDANAEAPKDAKAAAKKPSETVKAAGPSETA